jgi:hypothetical protein
MLIDIFPFEVRQVKEPAEALWQVPFQRNYPIRCENSAPPLRVIPFITDRMARVTQDPEQGNDKESDREHQDLNFVLFHLRLGLTPKLSGPNQPPQDDELLTNGTAGSGPSQTVTPPSYHLFFLRKYETAARAILALPKSKRLTLLNLCHLCAWLKATSRRKHKRTGM